MRKKKGKKIIPEMYLISDLMFDLIFNLNFTEPPPLRTSVCDAASPWASSKASHLMIFFAQASSFKSHWQICWH